MTRTRTATIVLAAAALLLGACSMFAAPHYHGPATDTFDGERFVNAEPDKAKGALAFLKWRLTRQAGPWRSWVDEEPGPPPVTRVGPGELRVTLINHATTLIQVDGINILTDPVWSYRVGPTSSIGIRRRRAPGVRFEDLPPIDAVVVSHNHYDHMDIPTLRRLAAAGAQTSVGMHYGTFALADDGEFEAVIRLELELAKRSPNMPNFWILDHGLGRDVPALD